MTEYNSKKQWTTVAKIGTVSLGPALNWTGGEKVFATGTAFDDDGGHPTSGPATRNDGTATYAYTPAIHLLRESVATDALVSTITRTPFADDGTQYPGGPYAMQGKVKQFGEPEQDKSSGDQSTIDIIFALEPNLIAPPS